MSTVTIIIIAVVVLLLLAVLAMTVFSPRKRAERRRQAQRREAAQHHRSEAEERKSRATVAQQRAEETRLQAERVAQEARLEREQAELHERRADLHEKGMADDELEFSVRDREGTRGQFDRDGDGRADADEGGVRRETEYVEEQRTVRTDGDGSQSGTGAVGSSSSSQGRFSREDGTSVERERFEEELASGGPDQGSSRREAPPRS